MKAILLFRRRIVLAENAFAELVLWRLPIALEGSDHSYKYRLAMVVDEVCVLRYDNERGKGDHRHVGDDEAPYAFIGPDQLLADFMAEVRKRR